MLLLANPDPVNGVALAELYQRAHKVDIRPRDYGYSKLDKLLVEKSAALGLAVEVESGVKTTAATVWVKRKQAAAPPPRPAAPQRPPPPPAAPAYRSLAAAEPAAPDVPPPVAGDTAPGVDPIQYDIRELRALDHINQITVAEKLAPPTFTFMEFRHPKTRQPTYQCQIEWQGRTQTGLVQNSKKLAKHSAAVEMIDQLSRDGILSITARS